MAAGPLTGVRVLALEQAVALPVGTRHLADLGADVVRVQSYRRGRGGSADLSRSKRQVAIDLDTPDGPDLFRSLAEQCDVVAHNFTPRVVAKFGIDYETLSERKPDLIYLSLTGFGMTGPWGPRPLFGPGAEAVSAHNSLIGEADEWPGRPGTVVYADNITGLTASFAVLAALDHRERTGEGQHIDLSLYEAMVSQLGPVIAEAALGAEPTRIGNGHAHGGVHEVFDAAGNDRHVAIEATEAQRPLIAKALGVEADEDLAAAIAAMEAGDVVERLQQVGVAAAVVADASDLASDAQLWTRGYWTFLETDGESLPVMGPPWGGGSFVPPFGPGMPGADNTDVLREFLGLSDEEIAAYEQAGVIGAAHEAPYRMPGDTDTRVERGELSRVETEHGGWRRLGDLGSEPGGLRQAVSGGRP